MAGWSICTGLSRSLPDGASLMLLCRTCATMIQFLPGEYTTRVQKFHNSA